jgi:hypothetical protein
MGTYQASSLPASAQRLVNVYPEILPDGAKGPAVLLPVPGLKAWANVGDGPIRGIHVMGGNVYVVSGEELYVISAAGASTLLGTIPGTADVYMTDNGTHIGIAADFSVYYANASTAPVQVKVMRMNGATYQDGYGIFSQDSSEQFWITATDDMTSIDALDFSAADAFADNLVGCISDHRELWLFGETSSEIWYNSGDASFPFQRIPSGFIERGCKSSSSIAKNEHRVCWLGDDLAVYASVGYQPQRISTPAIELAIKGTSDPSSACGMAYSQLGHSFYVLQFSDLCVAYDFTTQRWHERETYGEPTWRAKHYAAFNRKHLVGDFETGDVYELDHETYNDTRNGESTNANERTFTTQVIDVGGRYATMDEMLLDVETGVGAVSGNDSNPQVFLSVSDDGGRTWSTERGAYIGERGEYRTQVAWTRLGRFRQRICKFRTRANVKIAATGCKARLGVML